MKRNFLLLAILTLFALCAQAAGIDGQWTAQVPGRDGNIMDVTFTFKASGQQLTGNVENQYGVRDIADGKTSGEDLSFKVVIDAGGDEITFLYQGKISGDEIKFTRERKGGDFGPAKVEFAAKRKK